ncbi:hypothetical protein KL86DES1_10972 [uncultured Desulfovibrio sp.]|uniref:Uncharacterized protein n=1 Tax=uncultured Desulfovibrio sp. TaxID=167968 RepID=A0A212L1N6_9BACT|nr:hypothetical protein KL86DES1_10972 [uncultured Desulfovibrio sp.]VZH32844.1 conserved protein of unknown function [Desulfovibrio sp. 86]
MPGVFADNSKHSLAPDNLTLGAYFLDGRSYFHSISPIRAFALTDKVSGNRPLTAQTARPTPSKKIGRERKSLSGFICSVNLQWCAG